MVNLLNIELNCPNYVSNLPFVTESNFKDRHPFINDEFHNCQQSPSISFSLINESLIVRTAFNG